MHINQQGSPIIQCNKKNEYYWKKVEKRANYLDYFQPIRGIWNLDNFEWWLGWPTCKNIKPSGLITTPSWHNSVNSQSRFNQQNKDKRTLDSEIPVTNSGNIWKLKIDNFGDVKQINFSLMTQITVQCNYNF